jgi:hypothetical protein
MLALSLILAASALAADPAAYVFTAPTAILAPAEVATLPLTLTKTEGADSIDLWITYDPAAVEILSVARGPAAPTYTVYSNVQRDQGRVLVAMYSIDYPPPGSGAILNLTVAAIGPPGTVAPIRITRHWINENWVPSEAVDGWISIPAFVSPNPGARPWGSVRTVEAGK